MRTASALAKNSPPSIRRITTPSGERFSGWRRRSPYWSVGPGHAPELGDVRRRRAVEEQQQRHRDPDEQPGQRVEDQDPQQRRDRGDEVRPRGEREAPGGWPAEHAVHPRDAGKSTNSITAAITTAASVASGSDSNRPVSSSSVTTVSTATIRPDSCDARPAEPLTAVLDSDPLTTMPQHSPAPRFAAPSPSSSRLGSIS